MNYAIITESHKETIKKQGDNMNKRNYNLFTAITMITGIVIGSGIFFKSDDVLTYTKGNVLLGVIVFCVASIAIIFGSLTIAQLAMRTDKPGGIVSYAEDFVGMGTACSFGWFQTFLYLPTLTAVVSWVTGMYACQLFGWEGSIFKFTLIGLVVMVILFIANALSAKLGGMLQNGTMIIKIIPLILVAVIGLIFGHPGQVLQSDITSIGKATAGAGWMAAFAPIAFSLDGWIVSTSICHEVKNSKRNFPLALTISPLVILAAYIIYFVGMTSLLGPDRVIQEGNNSVFLASNTIFGELGAKIILIFVIISILGTVNGVILGFIRMPYSLAIRGMIPGSRVLKKESKRLHMPLNSAVFAFVLAFIWLVINDITQEMHMRGDISEIAIGVSYLNYIVLYVAVMRLTKKQEIKGTVRGYIIPFLAIIGSLIILSGSITHPLFIYYFIICLIILGAGLLFYKKNKNTII